MSAFVVDNGTINRVVTELAKIDATARIIHEETDCDIRNEEGRAKLGAAMLALNCEAVDQRYGKGESRTFRDDMGYACRMVHTTPVQAYKSLRCWLYQCSEGNVPDESLLYATMERVAGLLAEEIVRKTAEYDKADWD